MIISVKFKISFKIMNEISEHYRIIEKLGSQTNRKFGSVFLVENKFSGELGSLKTISKSIQNNKLSALLKEEATFNFEIEGLPHTMDFFETENEIFLIRKYVKGKPLDVFFTDIPNRNKKEVLGEIIKLLIPLFDYLKSEHIVHCDIKPSNILIDEISGEIKVAIIDLGMALRINDTNERSLLFPLGYAAPELIMNRLDLIDHRSDLFSFGIVLWRLFNGKLPLTHPNPSIYTNLQLTHPLPESDNLPKGLDSLLKKMTAKHQFKTVPNLLSFEEVGTGLRNAMDQRYNSLQEFYDDYQNLPLRKKWYFF